MSIKSVYREQRKAQTTIAVCICMVIVALCTVGIVYILASGGLQRETQVLTSGQIGQNVELNTDAQEIVMQSSEEFIYFSGFDDIFVEKGGSLTLSCDKSNADAGIYMTYTITDESGNVLYETGLIEPGMYVTWTPDLAIGEYKINLHEQPYQAIDSSKEISMENLSELYFVDQEIKLTVN